MNRFTIATAGFFVFATLACSSADDAHEAATAGRAELERASQGGPSEKDLAIIFDKERNDLITAPTVSQDGFQFFNQDWYDAMYQAYTTNGFGGVVPGPEDLDALLRAENSRSEWSNVSARIEVCAPLGVAPFQDEGELCWPEVRLVWQPLVRKLKLRPGLVVPSYADDRAAHTLFDVEPERVLSETDARTARSLIAKVRAAAAGGTWLPGAPSPLSASERKDFVRLRNLASSRLLADALALRSASVNPSRYSGIGPRPELSAARERSAFMARWASFLNAYARPAALKQLTSFTLRPGREPENGWTAAFVSLRPSGSQLQQVAEPLFSSLDGSPLFTVPQTETVVSVRAAADVFFNTREKSPTIELAWRNPAAVSRLLEDASLWDPNSQRVVNVPTTAEFTRVQERVRDRRLVAVPNTPCMNCHQLDVQIGDSSPSAREANARAINFHNLSNFSVPASDPFTAKLTNDGFRTSSRVAADVAYELEWIRNRLQ